VTTLRNRFALALLLALAGCARPPASAYTAGAVAGKPAAQTSIGKNAVGEACTIQDAAGSGGAADIYCGTWQQPSARVRPAADQSGAAATAAALPDIATASPWRAAIDQRYACEKPTATTILDGRPAELLTCTQRRGGWPHVALVALAGGQLWYADGVLPAATVMERAIGVRAGLIRADAAPPSSAADALLAQRLAAQSVSSGDIGQFDRLMVAGTRANLSGNPTAAEAAFRAALALQQKALGRDNPNTATAVMTLALQLSNEGNFTEATALFDRAARLAPQAADPIVPARLLHYRALDASNQDQDARALQLLQQAAAAYTAQIPPGALHAAPHASAAATAGSFARPGASLVANQDLLTDPAAQAALLGLVEVRRNEALVLRREGRLADSQAALTSATGIAEANGLIRPILAARLYRTGGVTAAAEGDAALALSQLDAATRAFGLALPQSKSLADTDLLRAGELAASGHPEQTLKLCHDAVATLSTLKAGTTPALMEPCLDAYGRAAAAADAPHRQALLSEMFTAAQLAQGGITSQQIAQATARLQENARDPRVADAIRRREDAGAELQSLYRQRDEMAAAAAAAGGQGAAAPMAAPPPGTGTTAALDARIKDAQAALADADAALQAASPNFGQLTQLVAPAAAVLAALYPHEALAEIALGPHDGWVLLLHDGQIDAGRVPFGTAEVGRRVAAVRASIELTDKLPTFDVAGARGLYDATLAPVAPALAGITRLVVAPTGPLLALPFEVLLTGPADAAHLADAPWLARRFTLVHVPAPGNFVSLRKVANNSRADRPWFGFGDFVPVTLAQAERSFPGAACGDSARLLAGLPQLAYARRELSAAQALLGGGDELLGPAFTVPAVMHAPLKQYRVLHFAAHALLPAELRCQSEPAIITSAPAGAADASQALLTASDVTGLDLDAELVILSACNSGGAGGSTAGESLSGLARAFFYAGARTLLVTHWSVNDQVAAYLIAATLQRMRADPALGAAGALRAAQLALLDQAGHGLPAEVAHPFFWAPFAAIGDGGGAGGPAKVAQRVSPPAPAGL
jgi:CHAT domain-containing protein